jgi:hypothetical protein
MAMNVTVKTKIRFNGNEYSSPDELPPEARSAYERAMAGGSDPTANRGITTRLVVNGQQFSSPAEMPAAERKLYDDAMQLVHDNAPAAATISKQSPADPGWLTKRQIQLIILEALLLTAVLFIAGRLAF